MHAVFRQDSCVCLHSYRKFSFRKLAWRLVMVCNACMQWWVLNTDRPDPKQVYVTAACKMRRTCWYIYLNFIKIIPRCMKVTFFWLMKVLCLERSSLQLLYSKDNYHAQYATENKRRFNVPPTRFVPAGLLTRKTYKVQCRNYLSFTLKFIALSQLVSDGI